MTEWIKILKDNYNDLVKTGVEISKSAYEDVSDKYIVEIDKNGEITVITKFKNNCAMSDNVCLGNSIEAFRLSDEDWALGEEYEEDVGDVEYKVKDNLDLTIQEISTCNDTDILAIYRTLWDDTFISDVLCRVNTETKEIFSLTEDGNAGHLACEDGLLEDSLLDEEYIIVNGEKYLVYHENAEEKHDGYWYKNEIWRDETYYDNYTYNDNDEYIWAETGEVAKWLYDPMCECPSERKEREEREKRKLKSA